MILLDAENVVFYSEVVDLRSDSIVRSWRASIADNFIWNAWLMMETHVVYFRLGSQGWLLCQPSQRKKEVLLREA